MPSEKQKKKHRTVSKSSQSAEPLRSLDYYVGDRLELTKQLFSCLKNHQIKQRLPPNLQVCKASRKVQLNSQKLGQENEVSKNY
jgi:Caspase activity and apoptosis inhibitor 1